MGDCNVYRVVALVLCAWLHEHGRYRTIIRTAQACGAAVVLLDLSPSPSSLNRALVMSSDGFVVPVRTLGLLCYSGCGSCGACFATVAGPTSFSVDSIQDLGENLLGVGTKDDRGWVEEHQRLLGVFGAAVPAELRDRPLPQLLGYDASCRVYTCPASLLCDIWGIYSSHIVNMIPTVGKHRKQQQPAHVAYWAADASRAVEELARRLREHDMAVDGAHRALAQFHRGAPDLAAIGDRIGLPPYLIQPADSIEFGVDTAQSRANLCDFEAECSRLARNLVRAMQQCSSRRTFSVVTHFCSPVANGSVLLPLACNVPETSIKTLDVGGHTPTVTATALLAPAASNTRPVKAAQLLQAIRSGTVEQMERVVQSLPTQTLHLRSRNPQYDMNWNAFHWAAHLQKVGHLRALTSGGFPGVQAKVRCRLLTPWRW